MHRKPEWGQNTPREQLVVLIMAARGDLSNITDGVIPEIFIIDIVRRTEAFLSDAQKILRDMPEGEW